MVTLMRKVRSLNTLPAAVTMLVLLAANGPSAHHAAIMFETSTPIRVKGTVIRYVWSDPHSAIIVEERTADGGRVRWALESSAPIRVLLQRGFTRDSFKPGDVIEACGYAPKASGAAVPGQKPAWLEGSDRVITARLVLTREGPREFSMYGPLELCLRAETRKEAPASR